jgi:serine/threonine protein kinase
MQVIGEILELGQYKLKITQVLGGKRNLTYLATDVATEEPYIVRIIIRPYAAEFQKNYNERLEEMLKRFFAENEPLQEKYKAYCRDAGYEIYKAAFEGQVILEAKILKDYRHPALSNLLLYTRDAGAYYLVLDHIKGRSLQELIETGEKFEEKKVLQWMRQIAEALHFLHSQGEDRILYNNINPRNIIIDEKDGNAHLVDLQRIKIYDEEAGKTEEWQDVLFLDSPPPYCPMEGYREPRSEIYALGVLSYELITGDSVPEVGERLKHDTLKPLRDIRPEYSKRLEKILQVCLELSSGNRFSSCESLMKALDSPDFPKLIIESEGSQVKSLHLGRVKKNFEKKMTLSIGLAFDDPMPIKVNQLSGTWNMKPDDGAPKITFSDISEKEGRVEGSLTIGIPELSPGIYEGHIKICTNCGDAEIPIKLEIAGKASLVPLWVGIALLVISLIVFLAVRAGHRPRTDRLLKRWNSENWPTLMLAIPKYLTPRYSAIADTGKWELCQEVPDILVKADGDELDISGTFKGTEGVRTGWITRLFSPTGKITVSVTLDEVLGGRREGAGMMILSSSGKACAVECGPADSHSARIAWRDKNTWEYPEGQKAVKLEGGIALLKIEYNKVEGRARGFVNEKLIGDVPMEMDDFAIFLYVALRDSGDMGKVSYKGLAVKLGPQVPRMPPYAQMTRGRVSLKEKPLEKAGRVIFSKKDELVMVQEEKGDWMRVRTVFEGHYEGWVQKKDLRNVLPREVKLD